MRFLTARWTNLALATYAVPPELLRPRLAPGLSLDLQDGRAFVSLVAFDFLDTRVLGIPWPGFRDFPEFNLRYYVRQGDRRGVSFVREIVPQPFVAWLARALYNEPYAAAPIENTVEETADRRSLTCRFVWKGRPQRLRVVGAKPAVTPEEESAEHLFKEHRWGFGQTRGGRLLRYEVVHPTWRVFPVEDHEVDVDWAHVYGPEWAFLQGAEPHHVLLAEGSPVEVYWRSRQA